eukprot:1160374-Pelagomonas_calceolata.AAC.4
MADPLMWMKGQNTARFGRAAAAAHRLLSWWPGQLQPSSMYMECPGSCSRFSLQASFACMHVGGPTHLQLAEISAAVSQYPASWQAQRCGWRQAAGFRRAAAAAAVDPF